jgi:segregation and condensation protein A
MDLESVSMEELEDTETHQKKDSDKEAYFKLTQFEGPLDLLLFLIRKNEVNIYDIPIADITEQYLEYLRVADRVELENLTEFYHLAATLLYIKSRMLLPVDIELDEDFEDPRQELVERLIEYQKFRKYTDLMHKQSEESEWLIERTKKQRILPFPEDDDSWSEIDIWDLLKNFSNMISAISSERVLDLFEEVSINEKTALITEFLERKEEFSFTDLIVKDNSIMEVVCAFLAILEAVKGRMILIYQNKFFGDIRIKARPLEEKNAALEQGAISKDTIVDENLPKEAEAE